MSAEMASRAARLISAGAGKSGKPCDRFTAPYCSARRVISRITDSVNRPAFSESPGLTLAAGCGAARLMSGSIELAIDLCVASDDFHVIARFGERYRIHELRRLAILLPILPYHHAIRPGVIGGEHRVPTAELLAQIRQIQRPEPNIVIGIEKPRLGIAHPGLPREPPACLRNDLHQPERVRVRMRIRLECGLLMNQPRHQHRIESFLA